MRVHFKASFVIILSNDEPANWRILSRTLSLSWYLHVYTLTGCLDCLAWRRIQGKQWIRLQAKGRQRRKWMTLRGMSLLRLRIAAMLICSFRAIRRGRFHSLLNDKCARDKLPRLGTDIY